MAPDIDDPFLEEVEPTAQQVGVDVPGSRSGFTDFINFGVFNGNFRLGPPNAAANVDPVGASGSNFVPGWRFVQSSNTVITAKSVLGSKQGAGSNLRFTHDASGTSGTVFVEQIIDIGGSAVGDIGATTRIEYQVQSGTWQLSARRQYLASDGSIAGMPEEFSATIPGLTSTAAPVSIDGDQADDPAPATARYLRYRVETQSSSANGSFDLLGVRRERATMYTQLVDSSRTTNGLFNIVQRGSNLIWAPTSTTQFGTFSGAQRVLNWQLVPITFSLVNIPANATTNMQLWGDTALALATPRISVPYASTLVGCSYRLSAVPTAGGASALRIVVQKSGADVWTPFTIAGSGGALADETTQPIGSDDFNKTDGIGVNIVTSATYAPTTADIAVVVWMAVKFDGL